VLTEASNRGVADVCIVVCDGLFHRAVGRPPIAHLAVLRAEAAATRLLRTPDPVANVGAALGWGYPNYFARRFRAHFGMSPTEYRSRRTGTYCRA
jgi:AraC family L-rhamnose operon transcriptional activator RhaR